MAYEDDDAQQAAGQETAIAFCNGFLQVLRLLRLYELDNVAYEPVLEGMAKLVAQGVERGGSMRIQSDEGMLYYNREPLRGGRKTFGTIQGLVKAMDGLGVAEVAFLAPVEAGDLRRYFGAMKECMGGEDVAHQLQARLEGFGLKDRLAVYAPGETTGKALAKKVEIDEQTYFPLAYARTLVLLREYVKNLRNEELNRYFTQKLYRALQEVVGLTAKYFNRWLSLTAVRNADTYLFNHMANVGLLSVLLGHQLGLGKVKLTELGLAGMLHGLGPFRSDPEVANKGAPSDAEWADFGKHPYRALTAHFESRKLTNKVMAAAVVGFHWPLHEGRIPMRIPPTEVHPFAQVVRICATYDALTSPHDDQPAMLPDQALKAMIEAKPGAYDPLILTAFVNMMGLFPTGTVVSLSTGEVAVVIHPNPEFPRRPLVAVLRSPAGVDVDGEFLDLALKDEQGRFPCTITGSVDPNELGIVVPEYLLA